MKTFEEIIASLPTDLELFGIFSLETSTGPLWETVPRKCETSKTIEKFEGEPGTPGRIEKYRKMAELELPLC